MTSPVNLDKSVNLSDSASYSQASHLAGLQQNDEMLITFA